MSRIGNKAIAIHSEIARKVSVDAAGVTVEGKSKLSMPLPPLVAVEVKDGHVHVAMASDDRKASAMAGFDPQFDQQHGCRRDGRLQERASDRRRRLQGAALRQEAGAESRLFAHDRVCDSGVGQSAVEGAKITVEGADKQVVEKSPPRSVVSVRPSRTRARAFVIPTRRIILKEGKSVG